MTQYIKIIEEKQLRVPTFLKEGQLPKGTRDIRVTPEFFLTKV